MIYVYIGTASSDEDIKKNFSKTARNKIVYVQQKWDYIFYKAIEEVSNNHSVCLSYPPVQTFPVGKCLLIKRTSIHGINNGIYIPTINLPIIKQAFAIVRVLRELIRVGKSDDLAIITHTLYFQSIVAARIYKKLFKKNTVIVSLVPDLPDYSTSEKLSYSKLNSGLFNIYKKISESMKGKVDGYVCFSELQMEKLDSKKPYIVMEGFSIDSVGDLNARSLNNPSRRVYFYAGNLKNDSGVLNFAKAFIGANIGNSELVICGEGEQKKLIEELKCPRIRLLGVLPKDKVLELEMKAYALINPRPVEENYAKYSFPSKLLEYMSTGTPVITTHLLSIPREYDDFLYYIDDTSIEGMKSALQNIDVDKNRGTRAREFVLSEKSPKAQAERVIKYVKSI